MGFPSRTRGHGKSYKCRFASYTASICHIPRRIYNDPMQSHSDFLISIYERKIPLKTVLIMTTVLATFTAISCTSEPSQTPTPQPTPTARPIDAPELRPTNTPQPTNTPRPTPTSVLERPPGRVTMCSPNSPRLTPAEGGYWHSHCARVRNDGGCDRRFRPVSYPEHYHSPSCPIHRSGEHERD